MSKSGQKGPPNSSRAPIDWRANGLKGQAGRDICCSASLLTEIDSHMPRAKRSLHALLFPLSRDRPLRRSRGHEENPALQAIWDVIARIPVGTVSTYGDVARAAGLPGRARQAGYALRNMPKGMHLPWHRVVGAGGKIAFPARSRPHREQVSLLHGEGVEVKNGRVAPSAMTTLEEI